MIERIVKFRRPDFATVLAAFAVGGGAVVLALEVLALIGDHFGLPFLRDAARNTGPLAAAGGAGAGIGATAGGSAGQKQIEKEEKFKKDQDEYLKQHPEAVPKGGPSEPSDFERARNAVWKTIWTMGGLVNR